ncbi:MAG: hypothetical protein HC835_21155 [Oscillatoriales cyanobacterium RM2_1_1]|nr:hypothetical protein [Oscillatoriales cyanobacterium SM2_3_0]NJO47902.1 hypothetical protein [Oscillatoriales cyanobacterium RM2_1_1]
MKNSLNFAGFSAGLAVLLLIIFAVLKWINIPVGSFVDWIIGGAIFWWLLLIVTVPWNIHFEAKETLAAADESKEKDIKVEPRQLQYVRLIARRSLWIAIALHLLSTIGLYALAVNGVSAVGYLGSGAALLLTVLRPAVRMYQYLAMRLALIRQEFVYPREDILELRDRVHTLEFKVQNLQDQLDSENPNSWVTTQEKNLQAIRQEANRYGAELNTLKATNQSEHDRLAREAEKAVAQLSTDGQVLNNVREIIRFFKEA